MNKLVSIIFPVYNVEKHIAKSIQSVLNQLYSNFELLIINDGTPDNSIKIAEQFDDPRIKIFHKENGGPSDARNFGLEKVNGEYIYFLDSDDWIESNLLERCIIAIEKYKSNLIIFGYNLDSEDVNGSLISSEKIIHNRIVFSKEKNNLLFESSTLGLMGYTWNKFYKTSFVKEYQLQFDKEISLFEDVIFNSKIYELVDKIVFIDEALYHYIDRPVTSLIKTFHQNSFALTVKMSKFIYQFLTTWQIDFTKKNNIIADSIMTGIRYSINGLFAYNNGLNFQSKLKYIKMVLNTEETLNYIKFYQPKSFKDKVYKKLIILKAVFPLYILCKAIK